jgi:hypothetical protein
VHLSKVAATLNAMHPLAAHLAPLIHQDVEQLRTIVAEWVVKAANPGERARYRRFGAELSALKRRIAARREPPSEEEIEIALTALLALAGRSPPADAGRRSLTGS